jgi:hypothetical protein
MCRRFVGDARYVGQDVNRASKFLLCRRNGAPYFSLDAYIRATEDALSSCRPNFFRRCVASLSIDIGGHYLRALLREEGGNPLSNPHRSARYQGHAAFQAHKTSFSAELSERTYHKAQPSFNEEPREVVPWKNLFLDDPGWALDINRPELLPHYWA